MTRQLRFDAPAFDAAAIDGLGVEDLRRVGGLKWSQYPDAIGAFVADMDFGTAPAVTEAVHAAVDLGLLGYLPEAVGRRMAEACAQWAGDRYGWAVDPTDVRPLADVIAGLQAAIEHFSRPGSPVVLPTPAYMPFLTVPPALGREVIEVPMAVRDGCYGYDLDALDAAVRAGGHLLVLCNPHNPVGRVLDYLDGNRRMLADLVAEHLPGVTLSPLEGTYLAWLDCRALGLAEPGEFFLAEAGVALIDGSRCGGAGRGFVRCNIATPRPVLARLVEQMGAALSRR